MIERNIIQPAAERSEIEEALQIEQLRYWQIDYSLKAEFKIQNIRFVHDPQWREGFFSVTGVADVAAFRYERVTPRIVFWHSVQAFFLLAQVSFAAGSGLIALLYLEGPVRFVLPGALILSFTLPFFVAAIEQRLYWWFFDRATRKLSTGKF